MTRPTLVTVSILAQTDEAAVHAAEVLVRAALALGLDGSPARLEIGPVTEHDGQDVAGAGEADAT